MTSFPRISEVSIQGFRSLRNIQGLKLNNLNALIGANGSGKSNFIDFFQMLAYAETESFQHFVQARGFAESILYMGSKTTPAIKATVQMKLDSRTIVYAFELTHSEPDILVFKNEELRVDFTGSDQSKHHEFSANGRESAIVTHPIVMGLPMDFQEIVGLFRDMLCRKWVYHFHDTSRTARIRKAADINNCRYLSADGSNLPAVLRNLKHARPAHYQRIVMTIRHVIPGFKDFILEPEELNPDKILLKWQGADPSYEFGIHQLPDGGLRFIALTVLLMQPPNKLPEMLIIDEPDLGLHPAAENLLAEMLHSASKRCQVIVATQSASLLDTFDPEDVVVAEIAGGETSLQRQSSADLEMWLEDYNLGEIWCKNLIGGQP